MSRLSKMRLNSVHSVNESIQQQYQPSLLEHKLNEDNLYEFSVALNKSRHHNLQFNIPKSFQRPKRSKPEWYQDPKQNDEQLDKFQSNIIKINKKPFSGITREESLRLHNTKDFVKFAKEKKKDNKIDQKNQKQMKQEEQHMMKKQKSAKNQN